jgi:hypothetical protein
MTGIWTKLHNEDLHNLHTYPDILKINKSKRVRWMGHVAHIGRCEIRTKILLENVKRRDQGVDGSIILKLI